MNKIFKLVVSEDPLDNEIAKMLLRKHKNKEIKEHIYIVYRYMASRNEQYVTPEFLMNPNSTYFWSIKQSGILPKYIIRQAYREGAPTGTCYPPKGKLYKEAIKSIKILLEE